jgi:Tfp pilus assembly protein PilP
MTLSRWVLGLLAGVGLVCFTQPGFGAEEDLSSVLEEAIALRDPFKRPEGFNLNSAVAVSDLERFPTEQFKLIGVITGASRLRAIVQDPEGKTHFVAERMRIGTRRGVIQRIRSDAVVVREKTVNVLGKEESSDNEIRLPEENRMAGGSSG